MASECNKLQYEGIEIELSLGHEDLPPRRLGRNFSHVHPMLTYFIEHARFLL